MSVQAAIAQARALWGITDAQASDDFFAAWYPQALSRSGVGWFGELRVTAVAHLLAHYALTIDPSGAWGGGLASRPVQSTSTGMLSVTYASPSGSGWDAELSITRPGAAWLALRDSRGSSIPQAFPTCSPWAS